MTMNGDADTRPTPEYDWSANATSRSRQQFVGASGLQVSVNTPDDPLALFELFLTDELLQVVVTETNCRASQLIAQTPARPHSRLTLWSDTTVAELRVFIAIILYEGVVQKPTQDMYWTTRPLLATPYVRYIMTRAVLQQILIGKYLNTFQILLPHSVFK